MISFDRITMSPDLCHGKPCVRGLRYPVTMVLDLLGSGMSSQEILANLFVQAAFVEMNHQGLVLHA